MVDKKKGKVEDDNDDMDLEDLEAFDDDFNFDDDLDMDGRTPTTKELSKEMAEEAGKGFMSSLIERTAKKSLGEGFEYNYPEAMEYATLSKEVFDKNKSRVQRSMYKLGTEVNKLLPFKFKTLNNFLEKYKEDNEQAREQSEEEMRDAGIESNLNTIFDKQLEIQSALEAKREARDEVESKERLVVNKISTNLLGSIDTNTAKHTAYVTQVGKEYYRKSLELQYKAYFIQADMLKTMRDYYKGFSLQFDSIVKNTGLPDFVKLKSTERISELARDKVIQSAYTRLFDKNKYVQGIKDRASKYIDNKVEGAMSSVDSFTDMLGMTNDAGGGGGGTLRMLGGVGAGVLGGNLGEKLSDKISPKLKERLSRNKYVQGGLGKLGTLVNSPTTFFTGLRESVNRQRESLEFDDSIVGTAGRGILGALSDFLSVTDPGAIDHSVVDDSLLSHKEPAIFDNKVHRSISEIIPMYLGKILQENTTLTKAYLTSNKRNLSNFESGRELHYDFTTRSLVNEETLRDNAEKTILGNKGVGKKAESVSSNLINTATSTLGKDKKANATELKILKDKDASKLVSEYITKVSKMEGVDVSYENLILNSSDKSKVDPRITALLEKNPKLKSTLEVLAKTQVQNKSHMTDRLQDVTNQYPVTALKTSFSNTTKLAGSEFNNNLDNTQSQILARAFTKYIMSNGDVTGNKVLSGDAFKYIREQDFPKVEDTIKVFSSQVKKILDIGDIAATSSLEALFGYMNTSLRENMEVSPEAFQTLRDLNPKLVDKGKLTTDNLVEGRLTKTKSDYISVDQVRELAKPRKTDVETSSSRIFSKITESPTFKGITDFKQELSEAGTNPFKLVGVLTKNAKKASAAIQANSKKLYGSAETKVKELAELGSKLSDSTAVTVVGKLSNKMSELEQTIGNLIATEELAKVEKEKTLNELKVEVESNFNSDRSISSIEREIKLSNAYHTDKIKLYKSMQLNLKETAQRLSNLTASGDKPVTTLVTEVREAISSQVERLKEIMDRATEVEMRAESTIE